MKVIHKNAIKTIVFCVLLLGALFHFWNPWTSLRVDVRPREGGPIQEQIFAKTANLIGLHPDVPFHIKEAVAQWVICFLKHVLALFKIDFIAVTNKFWLCVLCSRLAQNTCVCKADEKTFKVPLLNQFFPPVWAQNLQKAFLGNHPDPEGVKRHRTQEYDKFKIR